MSHAFVYLPDDEPDAQMFNGHAFVLRPNSTTEFRPYNPALSEADVIALEWIGDPRDCKPSGVAMVRWPGVSPEDVAQHVAGKLSKWGACRTEGPVTDGVATSGLDRAIVSGAERQYLVGTKEWAESVILSDTDRNSARRAAGLTVADSSDCVRARAWLASKEGALRDAGLL